MATIDVSDIFYAPFVAIEPVNSLVRAIEKHEEAILDLNRQQLDRGKDANGESLGRYKNFNYKHRWEPVDLKLKGDFRDRFVLAVDKKQSEIFSQDFKDAILTKRYGKDIYGIPETFIPTMGELVEDDFMEDYGKRLLNQLR